MMSGNYEHLEELEHIHKVLLKILIDFDQICQLNHIRYFLGGGTLLGAVRHGGFIPWDDDVDVMMLREDYDKLCALKPEQLPSHLVLQTYRSDPHYHGDMAKLRLKDTFYGTEFSSRFPEMNNGFFIDIFAHDKTSTNIKLQKIHIFLTRFIRSAVFHKWEQTPMHFYGKYKGICRAVTLLNKKLPMSFWEYLREKVFVFFRNTSSSFLYDGMGRHLMHGSFPMEWLDDTVYLTFEGYLFPAPKEYHKYLTYSYGDYRKIPDESEKIYHKIAKIDFGKY